MPVSLGGQMSDKIEIKFKCLKCGGTILSLPDNYTDDSIANCKACGEEFGRFGDVKAKAMETARAKVMGDVKAAFKKGGWKTN